MKPCRQYILLTVLLVLATLVAYEPSLQNGFVNFDDDARPLLEFLDPLPQLLARYHLDELRLRGTRSTILPANWKAVVDATVQKHGKLDILVNNAGISGSAVSDLLDSDAWDRLMAVNAKAPLFLMQRVLTIMRDGGRVINVSSGLTHMAFPQEVAYAMSKAALEQIALHFARHLGPRRITVNSVAPGLTNNGSEVFSTPDAVAYMAKFSAFSRVGEPSDVADVVAFLASDEARWVTGAFIDASGGTLLG